MPLEYYISALNESNVYSIIINWNDKQYEYNCYVISISFVYK